MPRAEPAATARITPRDARAGVSRADPARAVATQPRASRCRPRTIKANAAQIDRFNQEACGAPGLPPRPPTRGGPRTSARG